jgi:hypothetical protein
MPGQRPGHPSFQISTWPTLMTSTRYGMVGWQEFASNRTEILAKYDLAKLHESSRPVKTERGVTGEAAIREWLSGFLPIKYRVTSGYIIPDVLQTPDYKLYHHDVIIFDAINAPVLWTEGNPDQSEQGKRRAIPAKYVHAVLEVKSSFGRESATDALNKLRELNAIAPHFPAQFSCSAIFIELPKSLASKGEFLKHLLPDPPIFAFRGGLILRCELNREMSGEFSILSSDGGLGSVQNVPDLPLAKDIDSLNIYLNSEGQCVIAEAGGGAMFVSDGVSNWMVSKQYGPTFCTDDTCVSLSWSANGFSQFALDLLNCLEGRDPRENQYRFGQIFDHLERRN